MDTLMRNEAIAPGTDKIARYGWSVKDAPGTLIWLKKDGLLIDHSYQRFAKSDRVLALAQNWSWVACGAIIVAKRPHNSDWAHFVMDGQHRVMAALKRSDISTLPCLVFQVESVVEEAVGFYDANANRRMPSVFDKWRAMLMAGDHFTVVADKLIAGLGRSVSAGGGPNTVRCLGVILRAAKVDEATLKRIFPLVGAVCEGQVLHERIFEGLFYIERCLPEGQSLTDKQFRERVMRVGFTKLLDAANRAAAFYARGGAKVYATGMLEALNKGYRIHIALREQDQMRQ